MKKTTKKLMSALCLALTLTFAGITVLAQEKKDAGDIKEAVKEGRDEAREATKVLNEIMSSPEKAIPRRVFEKAVAIAVFPNISKGGFIVGGTGGDGVIARRTANGWSAPAFYDMGGADIGLQLGAKKSDYIMLFMQEGALKDLLNDKLELGAGLSFAAGPVDTGASANASANTNLTGSEAVLVYSRTEGLFGGATVGGGSITADNSRNQAFYKMNGGQFLAKPDSVNSSKLPSELKNFSATVKKYAK